MILEYKNYVSSEFVDEIQQTVKPLLWKTNKETAYNRDGITFEITDYVKLNPELEGLKELDAKLFKVFSELSENVVKNRFRPKFFSTGDSGYEYHLYRPGDVCYPHADGEVSDSLLRYATVILFLTDNEDGELIFPVQNATIKPEKGKIVVFPPYGMFWHYSKPSVKDREIVMTWFVYNSVNVSVNAT